MPGLAGGSKFPLMRPTGISAVVRLFLGVFVLLVFLLAGSQSSSPSPPAARAAQPPNFVVVMTDDQDQASIRAMPRVRSLLGDQGTTFTNSFVNFSLCCPSRATFLTGQYAHNHGVMDNAPPDGGFEKLDSSDTLPVWLRAGGYRTAHVGRYLNGYGNLERGQDPLLVPPGWSEWYTHTAVPPIHRAFDYDLNENGELVHYGSDPADFNGDVFTDKAVDFIRRAGAAPFFLSVSYTAPHDGEARAPCPGLPKPAPRHEGAFAEEPLPQPPSFNEADVSDKPARVRELPLLDDAAVSKITARYRCRLESLLHVDEGVEEIIAALSEAGKLEETFVIYTSDNGFMQGEHRIERGKQRMYEESIQVPLLVRGPGVAAGARVPDLATNADLAPTILDAAGVTPGLVQDGRSLLDPPLAGRHLLIQTRGWVGVRNRRYVYAEHPDGEKELYDLAADPFQLESVHEDPAYSEVRELLAERLDALRTCAGASCQDVIPPGSPTITDTDPDSPANDNSPDVKGQAEAGSTVRLYQSNDCSGAVEAQDSASTFDSPGLTATVADDRIHQFAATATDQAGNTSSCSSSISYVEVSSPPSASLALSPNPALTGDTVGFDASASSGLTITRYEWDLDGDGSFETDTGADPTATRSYSAPAEIDPGVRVTNGVGLSDVARAPLSIRLGPPAGELGVSINNGEQFTNDSNVTINAFWPLAASSMVVSNDGGFLEASELPVAASTPWQLDSSGPERLPKTIYVRFLGGASGPETYQDDIILDQSAPKLVSAELVSESGGGASSSAKAKTAKIRLKAKDSVSGVDRVQITTKKSDPGDILPYKRKVKVKVGGSELFVRVQDRAGNFSRWKRAG
jgi:N-acetylglucosamine-6-sulfatase